MKRFLIIPVVLLAAVAVLVVGTGASEDDGSYRVRAIFDNAFTVIPGLDVKIAGVRVGQVESLDVTEDKKAAVVLRIDEPGFQDFRTDASCTIRPQGLIGEKFVECDPTLPRREGTEPPPELEVIPEGEPGAGQRLLPVERTGKPVDIDLLNNSLRLPYRERLSLIINELGTAVAGRGGELREVVKRLNPGLRETDKVLKILADQNEVLADLAVQSDTALAPLARERERVAGFIEGADTTLKAQANASQALEDSLEKLPTFLQELQPTMQQLESLSDEAIPVVADLEAVAPQISAFIEGLGPFSTAAIPATTSLGETAETGGQALINSKDTIDQVGKLAADAKVPSQDLQALTESLEESGTFERLLSFVVLAATSQNGFDDLGYYARAWVLQNDCANYFIAPVPGCGQRLGGEATKRPQIETNEARETADAEVSAASTRSRRTREGEPSLRLPTEISTPSKTRAPKEDRVEPAPETTASDSATAEETVADYLLGDGS
ncbi:MAG: MCE family protein [Solirubrobacteraceae bacterium]|nr:MCE family protein [Solirubrobacteraceae bacterium]